MIIIPAIDLMNGQCVRLEQGDFTKQTIYSKDPLQTAKQFELKGFSHLHMVDLDGAKKKVPVHFDVLRNVTSHTNLKVDFSGGIRSLDQARQVFAGGAFAITIGSMAVNDPDTTSAILDEFGPDKVILGADVKNEYIATAGWLEQSDRDIFSFLNHWLQKGFVKVMITDVSKDGMMQGPSTDLYKKVLKQNKNLKLIASGGISGMNDILELKQAGCYAAITGKALYENSISMEQLENYFKS
jgi:phosphoribosylformimino-5-aminoimidazole carboxamide ribotide isomerase